VTIEEAISAVTNPS